LKNNLLMQFDVLILFCISLVENFEESTVVIFFIRNKRKAYSIHNVFLMDLIL